MSAIDGRAQTTLAVIAEDWVFEPIARIDDNDALVPVLASVIELDGPHRARFKLRPGATFSDESPVTFESLKSSLDESAGFSLSMSGEWILADNEKQGGPIDAALLPMQVRKKDGNRFLGTGPFVVVGQDDRHALLKRRVSVPGKIDQIELDSIPTNREAMARALRGELQVLPRIEPRNLEFFEHVTKLRVIHGASPQGAALFLGAKRLSAEERLALLQGIDIKELRNTAYGDTCASLGHAAETRPLPPGRKLDVIAPEIDDDFLRLGLATRRSLGMRGGQLLRLPLEQAFAAMKSGDYDLFAAPILMRPQSMFSVAFRQGPRSLLPPGYANAELERAAENNDHAGMMKAIEADPPLIFVCQPERYTLVDSRLKGARVGPWGLLETLPNWEVGE
ncbi:MAG: hypothetical protein JST92_00620 [Deltaproteobacteria bacterium]|nr:hypothetical protein [Deltaproteobacteria bacterium]